MGLKSLALVAMIAFLGACSDDSAKPDTLQPAKEAGADISKTPDKGPVGSDAKIDGVKVDQQLVKDGPIAKKVEEYVPKSNDIPGWVENPDEGNPGVEAGYTTADIEAIIDGSHDPYRDAGCNGFAKQDYKKGSGKCQFGICDNGTYGIALFLWDMKDATGAKAMFDKNKKEGETAGVTFETVPNALTAAVIGNQSPQWKAYGHKGHYVYKIYATYAPGDTAALKTEAISFVQAFAGKLP
jgi:hypothetical protein